MQSLGQTTTELSSLGTLYSCLRKLSPEHLLRLRRERRIRNVQPAQAFEFD